MNEFFHFPEMKNLLWGKKKKNFKTRFPFWWVSTFWREKIKGCKYIFHLSFEMKMKNIFTTFDFLPPKS